MAAARTSPLPMAGFLASPLLFQTYDPFLICADHLEELPAWPAPKDAASLW